MSFFNTVPLIVFLAFTIAILERVIWLKKHGIKVVSNEVKKSPFQLILPPVFGALFILWLFEIVQPLFFKSLSILPEFATKTLINSKVLKITGTVVVLFSLVLWITTLLHFNKSLRFGLDPKNPGKLITTGIFSVSRNPFFLSIDLYFAGIALILPDLFFISFTALAIISIHFFILKEEKFLLKIYGEDYKMYAEKTERYF